MVTARLEAVATKLNQGAKACARVCPKECVQLTAEDKVLSNIMVSTPCHMTAYFTHKPHADVLQDYTVYPGSQYKCVLGKFTGFCLVTVSHAANQPCRKRRFQRLGHA